MEAWFAPPPYPVSRYLPLDPAIFGQAVPAFILPSNGMDMTTRTDSNLPFAPSRVLELSSLGLQYSSPTWTEYRLTTSTHHIHINGLSDKLILMTISIEILSQRFESTALFNPQSCSTHIQRACHALSQSPPVPCIIIVFSSLVRAEIDPLLGSDAST